MSKTLLRFCLEPTTQTQNVNIGCKRPWLRCQTKKSLELAWASPSGLFCLPPRRNFFRSIFPIQGLRGGLLIVLLLLFTKIGNADFLLHTWENHSLTDKSFIFQGDRTTEPILNFQINPMYYTTSANYDSSGDLFSLENLSQYTRSEVDLTIEGQIFPELGLFGRLTTAEILQPSSHSWSLMDQTIGLNFHVYQTEPISLNIQLQVDFPAYSAELFGTPSLSLGDRSVDTTLGFFANLPLLQRDSFSLAGVAGAGYTSRTKGFSAAIPWSASFFYMPVRSGFLATWTIGGFFSLDTDHNLAPSPSRQSLIINGINSSLFQMQGKIGYLISSTHEVNLAIAQSIWGQDVPSSTQYILGYQYRIFTPKDTNPIHLTPKEFGKTNAGFLTYSLDAHILNTNDRLNLVKIDKGREDGVEVAQIFDIFKYNFDHTRSEPIARGEITSVRLNDAAIEITEFYKEVPIETDFIAKRLVR